MTTNDLVENYLAALSTADLEKVLRLFSDNGVVHSPLYGRKAATAFYPALFRDTAQSQLQLRTTMTGQHQGRQLIAFWFDFDWTLANGSPAPFTVVDVAELDADGKIAALHIVYDTAPIRAVFDAQRQESSSRETPAAGTPEVTDIRGGLAQG